MPTITPNLGLKKPLGNETISRAAYNENLDILDQNAAKSSDLAAHLADNVPHIPYVAAAGVANAYTATLNPAPTAYAEGMAMAVKINVENTGASTINVNELGAKSIKKPNGNNVSAGNLKVGSIYTMRYNGTNFILQGSDAAGNAIPADVLSGKTFTNDQSDQTGTMINKVGSATVITPGTVDQAISQGYYGGAAGDGKVLGDSDLITANIKAGANIFGVAGNSNVVDTSPGTAVAGDILASKVAFVDGTQLTGTMVDRGTVNYTPGTANQTVAAGKHSGSGVVAGDANLVAANILKGKTIFNVSGVLVPRLAGAVILQGRNAGGTYFGVPFQTGYTTGTGTYKPNSYSSDGFPNYYVKLEVSGFGSEVSMVTVNPVDLTEYSQIGVYSGCSSFNPQAVAVLAVSSVKIADHTVRDVYLDLHNSTDYHAWWREADISALNGLYYIRCHLYLSDDEGGSKDASIDKILLL